MNKSHLFLISYPKHIAFTYARTIDGVRQQNITGSEPCQDSLESRMFTRNRLMRKFPANTVENRFENEDSLA